MAEEETHHEQPKASSKQPVGAIDGLIAGLEPYFTTKAPFQLPEGGRVWIAEYSWIISLVLGLLSLPAVLGLLALAGIVGSVGASVGVVMPLLWVSMLALIIQIGFLFWAVPGLRVQSYSKGWKIVFYSELFSAAYAILSLSIGSIVGAAIGLLIGFFFLFQVKSKFH